MFCKACTQVASPTIRDGGQALQVHEGRLRSLLLLSDPRVNHVIRLRLGLHERGGGGGVGVGDRGTTSHQRQVAHGSTQQQGTAAHNPLHWDLQGPPETRRSAIWI